MSVEFEVLRFEAVPATGGVAVVELEGTFAAPRSGRERGAPTLVVEHRGVSTEARAVTFDDAPWSATFAVVLEAVLAGDAQFGLALGRGPLIGLPAPTVASGPDEDRYVRLARQANDLRHTISQQAGVLAEAEAHVAEVVAEREDARAERDEVRTELERITTARDAAERTAAAARDQRTSAEANAEALRGELTALREELRGTEERATAAERERAALRARAESAERTAAELRDTSSAHESHAGELQAELVAAEDEVRVARRELRDTRARLEQVLREHKHAAVPARRGHVVEGEVEEPAETTNGDAPTARFAREDHEPEPEPQSDEAPERDEEPTIDLSAAVTEARPRKVVHIGDTDTGDEPVLDPAAIGARYIEPAETRPGGLTPARIAVGLVLVLLIALLAAILLGASLV